MSSTNIKDPAVGGLILVLGATGKTGRRIVERLEASGFPTRRGSRSAFPFFDWNNEANWDDCLAGVEAVYINYAPDLAIPGAADSIQAFVDRARQHGVTRLVLLSGRGQPLPKPDYPIWRWVIELRMHCMGQVMRRAARAND